MALKIKTPASTVPAEADPAVELRLMQARLNELATKMPYETWYALALETGKLWDLKKDPPALAKALKKWWSQHG